MNIISVEDPADPRLEPYHNLRHEDTSKRGDRFIAEGRLVVKRLLASHYPVESVLAEPGCLAELESLAPPEVPILVVSQSLIREVAGFNFHRGLLACGRRIPFSPVSMLEEHAVEGAMALATVSLNDLENLGSLLRTAAAFGIFRVLLNRQTADPLCRRVLRVSMGAALKMQYFDLVDPQRWFEENRQTRRWRTIATTLAPDSIPLERVARGTDAKMIVMGSEGDGLPEAIQQACLQRAKIPMAPGIDSLNVAVAGAIALYEFTRKTPN